MRAPLQLPGWAGLAKLTKPSCHYLASELIHFWSFNSTSTVRPSWEQSAQLMCFHEAIVMIRLSWETTMLHWTRWNRQRWTPFQLLKLLWSWKPFQFGRVLKAAPTPTSAEVQTDFLDWLQSWSWPWSCFRLSLVWWSHKIVAFTGVVKPEWRSCFAKYFFKTTLAPLVKPLHQRN